MTDKDDDFQALMNQMDCEERFNVFSDMIALVLSGDWRDRLDIDGIYVGDDRFQDSVNKYLRAIRRRNHADRYLKPKPVF